MEKIIVKLVDLDVNPAKNARFIMEGKNIDDTRGGQSIAGLAQMIERDGQLTPLIVSPLPKGRYQLIAGFRRYEALKLLKRDTADAIVATVAEKDAAIINLMENEARKDLTPIEKARGYIKARKGGLSGGQIASRLGVSKSHVNNLMRVVENLPPSILERWEKECRDENLPKVCYTDDLVRWSKMSKSDALAAFSEAMGAEEEKGKGKGKKGKGKPAPRTVKHGVLAAALAHVKKDKGIEGAYKRGIIDTLMFAMGTKEKIGDVFPVEESEGDDDGEGDAE